MTIDAIVGPDLRLLLVGLSPPPLAVATGVPFAHRTNRFYDALYLSGLTSYRIDPSNGDADADRAHLIERGIGITRVLDESAPENPTAHDIAAGLKQLERFVEHHRPRVAAFTGLGTARTTLGDRHLKVGQLSETIAGTSLWALPDTSGLNFRFSIEALTESYAAARDAAGIQREPAPGHDY